MKLIPCKQGSAEWHFARLGIPTASHFANIITPKTRKLSASADGYMHELASAWLTGMPHDAVATAYMERGTEMEKWAVSYYEMQRNVTVQRVGFCLRDDGSAGASPDGLIGDDGGLEIKCPGAKQHAANLLGMTDEHFTQVQGGLWVTGRQWWDLLSYHPTMPSAIVRFTRDEEYIAALEVAMAGFTERYQAKRQQLLDLGCTPADRLDPQFEASLR